MTDWTFNGTWPSSLTTSGSAAPTNPTARRSTVSSDTAAGSSRCWSRST